MKNKLLIASTGFALFSMFFGSGNLVIPLEIGKISNGHFLVASLGLFLTGVIVPFLGVFGMMLFKGDNRTFFSSLGKPATFWIPFITLALMGPFGVLARCITVAHGSYQLLFPDVTLPLFSIVLCVILFLFTKNKTKIVSSLGTILTPFLLLSLGIIALLGFFSTETVQIQQSLQLDGSVSSTGAWEAFKEGFFKGYHTMDLLAAFFFSSFILNYLNEHSSGEMSEQTKKDIFIKSTVVGTTLLTIVYIALVYLGALYASQLATIPPQQMLGVVAQQTLGTFSAPIVCIAAMLACFTTAVVLSALFADFLRKEVTKNKVSTSLAMAITLSIAFIVSTFEFAGIAKIIGPILELLYPALITLTVINIASQLWGVKRLRWPIALTLVMKIFL